MEKTAPLRRPPMGPNSLAVTEQALAAIEPLGLAPDAALTAVETVAAFVRGYVIRELPAAITASRRPQTPSGT